jgi:hypothetical protein
MNKGNEKRRKRNAELLKRDIAKQLEDVCLHCVFFKMHQDKWSGWEPGRDDDGKAFNDLAHSAIRIVAEIFTMLSENDQMMFMRNVMERNKVMESGALATFKDDDSGKSIKEVLEAFRDAFVTRKPNDPTKH